MVVAVFSDSRCPYFRDLVPVLDSLAGALGGKVALELHHYSLSALTALVRRAFGCLPEGLKGDPGLALGMAEVLLTRLLEQARPPGKRGSA